MRNAIFARLVALRSAQPHDADFGMALSPMAPRRTSPHHTLPPSPRTRWVVVALLALPVVLAAPSDRPARAAGVGRPVAVPQSPELATLRQRSAEAERRLIAATAAYEVAEARLAQSVMRALSQRRKADEARQRVEVNQQRVDALLRSSYENAVPPGLSLLSAAGDQDAGSLLDAATYLGQVTQDRQDLLRDQMVARKVADELQQAADQAATEATSQEHALEAQVASLRSQAAQAQNDLETLMRRLVAEQRVRERAAQLARDRRAREQARRLAAARSVAAPTVAPARCGGVTVELLSTYGSYPNGLIPAEALCPLSIRGHMLRADAALAFERLALAYRQAFGGSPCLTDSYRSYAEQVRVYQDKPSLAAVPGTSNHGWGLAVDLCGGLQSFNTPQQSWMRTNAGRYGWYHPGWAGRGGSRPEPWHWEYGNR